MVEPSTESPRKRILDCKPSSVKPRPLSRQQTMKKMTQKKGKSIIGTMKASILQFGFRKTVGPARVTNHAEVVHSSLKKFEDLQTAHPQLSPFQILKLMKEKYPQFILHRYYREGSIPGVEVGDCFTCRAQLWIVGLHRYTQAGIDWIECTRRDGAPCTKAICIVVSGAYEDDEDDGETLIYTGAGGNDLQKSKKQIENQKLKGGTEALDNSRVFKNVIRVIRCRKDARSATGKFFSYDGLYKIVSGRKEKGKSGFDVFKYKLVREPGQKPLIWPPRCVGNSPNGEPIMIEDIEGQLQKAGLEESDQSSASELRAFIGRGEKRNPIVVESRERKKESTRNPTVVESRERKKESTRSTVGGGESSLRGHDFHRGLKRRFEGEVSEPALPSTTRLAVGKTHGSQRRVRSEKEDAVRREGKTLVREKRIREEDTHELQTSLRDEKTQKLQQSHRRKEFEITLEDRKRIRSENDTAGTTILQDGKSRKIEKRTEGRKEVCSASGNAQGPEVGVIRGNERGVDEDDGSDEPLVFPRSKFRAREKPTITKRHLEVNSLPSRREESYVAKVHEVEESYVTKPQDVSREAKEETKNAVISSYVDDDVQKEILKLRRVSRESKEETVNVAVSSNDYGKQVQKEIPKLQEVSPKSKEETVNAAVSSIVYVCQVQKEISKSQEVSPKSKEETVNSALSSNGYVYQVQVQKEIPKLKEVSPELKAEIENTDVTSDLLHMQKEIAKLQEVSRESKEKTENANVTSYEFHVQKEIAKLQEVSREEEKTNKAGLSSQVFHVYKEISSLPHLTEEKKEAAETVLQDSTKRNKRERSSASDRDDNKNLKRNAKENGEGATDEKSSESDGDRMSDDLYEVERILQRRTGRGKNKKEQFLVLWKGYSRKHATWEPKDNLINCEQALLDFEQRIGRNDNE